MRVRFTLFTSFFRSRRLAILVMVCYAVDVFTDFKRFIVIWVSWPAWA